jgi:prolipoprotein diacylglyceryltransferase
VEEAAPWVQSAIGWLAISFPAGVPGGGKTGAIRFDLGLMDSLLSWIILAVLLLMARRPRHAGVLMATGPLIYMPVRFGLDFLRNADLQVHDARYGGFTPAQFGCVIMFALALGILVRSRKREIWPEPGTQPWVEPAEAGAEAAGAGSAAGGGATGSPSRRPRRRR